MSHLVCNASPLIVLAKARMLELLPKLFDIICLPQAVANEIMAGPPTDPMKQALPNLHWLKTVSLSPPISPVAGIHLGIGEAEVLEYARVHSDHVALLDDRAARRAATAMGVKICGTLSVVASAVKQGYVTSFVDAAAQLKRAGLYVSNELIVTVSAGLKCS